MIILTRVENYSLPWYPGHDTKYGRDANCMVSLDYHHDHGYLDCHYDHSDHYANCVVRVDYDHDHDDGYDDCYDDHNAN